MYAGQIMAALVNGRIMQRQPLGNIVKDVKTYATIVTDIAETLAEETIRRDDKGRDFDNVEA